MDFILGTVPGTEGTHMEVSNTDKEWREQAGGGWGGGILDR